MNAKLTETLALLGILSPQTVANTETFSGVVDMKKCHQALVVAALGNMASETIDVKVYTCNSDGSSAAALVSATQLAASSSANDNTQILANVRASDLIASGKQYIKVGVVTGGSTGGPVAVAILGQLRQGQATNNDLSSVAEIIG